MPAGSGKIGELHVELRADASQFEAGMKQAEVAAVETSDKVETSLKKQASAFTAVIGKVFAVIGVFETFYQIGTKVSEMLETGATRAENFLNNLDASDAKNELASVEKQVAALQTRLAASKESTQNRVLNFLTGHSETQITSELSRLEERLNSLRAQKAAEYNRAKEQKQKEALRKEQQAQIDSEAAALAGQQKLDEEDLKRQADLIGRINDEEQRRLDILKQQTEQYLKQVAAFQDLQQRQVGGFGLGNMEALLSNISRQIDRLPGFIQ